MLGLKRSSELASLFGFLSGNKEASDSRMVRCQNDCCFIYLLHNFNMCCKFATHNWCKVLLSNFLSRTALCIQSITHSLLDLCVGPSKHVGPAHRDGFFLPSIVHSHRTDGEIWRPIQELRRATITYNYSIKLPSARLRRRRQRRSRGRDDTPELRRTTRYIASKRTRRRCRRRRRSGRNGARTRAPPADDAHEARSWTACSTRAKTIERAAS